MISQERLKELLDYDPETGVFRWRVTVNNKHARAGRIAGCPSSNGYIRIGINKEDYYAHRLAWLYVHGVWPKEEIDHIDRDKTNNRITNLRECTHGENLQNTTKHARNTSGYCGVTRHIGAKKWTANISHNGEHYYLGLFDTTEEAHSAYVAAKAKLHTFHPFVTAKSA